jgi:hypothetical protein
LRVPVKLPENLSPEILIMSDHAKPVSTEPQDPVEEIVPLMPVVLPVVGGVLMFLLAFIAISMA